MSIAEEEEVRDHLDTMQHAAQVRQELQALVQDYRRSVPFLQPGRIVKLLSHIDGENRCLPRNGSKSATRTHLNCSALCDTNCVYFVDLAAV